MKRLIAVVAALTLLPAMAGLWLLLRKKGDNKEESR